MPTLTVNIADGGTPMAVNPKTGLPDTSTFEPKETVSGTVF